MTIEELLKYADKIIGAYQTIPVDSFRNSITYESLLDNDYYKERGYNDSLPYPAGMCPRQKVEGVNVGFYPVYFYDTESVGMIISFFSTAKKKKMTFGPFRTAEELVDELMKYEGVGNYEFICNRMKMFSSFIMNYDEGLNSLQIKLKYCPELPVMNCVDNVMYLGESLDIATEYVINPYAYDTVMYRNIHLSVFDNLVNESILTVSEQSFKDWERVDSQRINKVLKRIKTSIKDKREMEDGLLKKVKELC